MIKWSDLTEAQKALVDPGTSMAIARTESAQERVSAQKRVETAEPKLPKLERNEHGLFEAWLILNGYAYRHSRTDKRTRETVGAPDFSVYIAHDPKTPLAAALAIEFKLAGNKLSPAQQAWAGRYGGTVHVLGSAAEAIGLVKKHFSTPKH